MDVGNLNIKITADTRGVDAGITKTKRALGSAANEAQGFGAKLQSGFDAIGIGGVLAVGAVTTAVGKFASDSVKAAVSFDSSMANINSILQLSGTEIDALGGKILAIGANTRAGPQKVAEAFTEIVGGVADATTHMDILNASIAASEAGNADLTATTGALVSVMNSYGFSAEKAAFVSDVMTKTVGDGVGSMDEFASAMGLSAGLAAQSGISFDELGGSMAYLTTQGFSAAQAGTRLTSIITAFLKPNDKMKRALIKMGVESGSAGLEMYGLAGMTELLSESMGGSTDAMSEALGTTEALTGALALNAPGFEDFIDNFKATTDGATDAAQAIQNASMAASFDQLNAQVERLKIGLGGLVAPVLQGAVNFVVTGLEAGADIVTEAGNLADNIVGIIEGELNKEIGWDPEIRLKIDDEVGPIRTQLHEFWAGLGNVPVQIILDPKYAFMADLADDLTKVVTTEIAGIKPIEAIISTLPSFLPPAIPNTIAAMNDLITGIQEQGISPTQQLIIDTVAHVQFTTAMDRVKADVYNANRPEPRTSSDYMLPEPVAPAETQTWADSVIAQYQAAIDLASQTPLQAAFEVDVDATPNLNRPAWDEALVDEFKTPFTPTVLLNATPELTETEQFIADAGRQVGMLNIAAIVDAAITAAPTLSNPAGVAGEIVATMQGLNYSTTVQATLTVQRNVVYQDTMPGGATGSGTNYDGTPDNDGFPWTPMATGGKVPYDNFAALLHKGEIVVPANYADGMGGSGVTIIVNASNLMGSRQEVIEWVREGMAESGY